MNMRWLNTRVCCLRGTWWDQAGQSRQEGSDKVTPAEFCLVSCWFLRTLKMNLAKTTAPLNISAAYIYPVQVRRADLFRCRWDVQENSGKTEVATRQDNNNINNNNWLHGRLRAEKLQRAQKAECDSFKMSWHGQRKDALCYYYYCYYLRLLLWRNNNRHVTQHLAVFDYLTAFMLNWKVSWSRSLRRHQGCIYLLIYLFTYLSCVHTVLFPSLNSHKTLASILVLNQCKYSKLFCIFICCILSLSLFVTF